MLQEGTAVTWDSKYTCYGPPRVAEKLLVLFLLATSVVALTKLVRTWIALPPFAKLSVDRVQSALPKLERTAVSLRRWLVLTLLAWALVTSVTIVNSCQTMLTWEKLSGWQTLHQISELSMTLTFALVVVTFLYLIRWYILNRIERFRK